MIEDHEQHWAEAVRDYEAYRANRVKCVLRTFLIGIAICSVSILAIAWSGA